MVLELFHLKLVVPALVLVRVSWAYSIVVYSDSFQCFPAARIFRQQLRYHNDCSRPDLSIHHFSNIPQHKPNPPCENIGSLFQPIFSIVLPCAMSFHLPRCRLRFSFLWWLQS